MPKESQGNATLILSKMSNNFGDINLRAEQSGLFKEVLFFDEKRDTFFPQLAKYKLDRGNIVFNSLSRIIFTKKFAKLQERFVPVDFTQYDDIYVYCDNDPIGIYLSQHKIYYHAVEDGLNYLKPFVPAFHDNKGAFKFKAFLSDKLNLIFIRDGFNKYCLDMEVNDISVISFPCKKYKEVPRQPLFDRLTEDDKQLLLSVFIRDYNKFLDTINNIEKSQEKILILTEPLCDLATRERIFRDIIEEYSQYGTCFIKPHPRDELNYPTVFSDVLQFDATVPMELLSFVKGLHFNKVVGVFTQLNAINYADEKIHLGEDFMDKYERPEIHRKQL